MIEVKNKNSKCHKCNKTYLELIKSGIWLDRCSNCSQLVCSECAKYQHFKFRCIEDCKETNMCFKCGKIFNLEDNCDGENYLGACKNCHRTICSECAIYSEKLDGWRCLEEDEECQQPTRGW